MTKFTNMELKELQNHELEMCKVFTTICDKLHLKYYLMGGSMLGAVRHQGYIPWDDDLDVGMPRKDYDIFLNKASQFLPSSYFLQTHITDPEYPYNFAKLRDSNTTFVEIAVKNLHINHGVFIDIFPLDIYPDGKIKQKWLEFRKKLTEVRIRDAVYFKKKPSYSLSSKIAILVSKFIYRDYKDAVFYREKLITSCKHGTKLANHGGAWKTKEIVPMDWYGEGKMVDFEGIKLRIPSKSDKWLSQVYGDYMQLPPKEKRIAHHYTEFFDLHKPYTDYKK